LRLPALGLLAALTFTCSFPAQAQLGPEAPMLAHQTLTPNGLDLPDAAERSLCTMNPAGGVALQDFGVRSAAETDLGWLDFSQGPCVTSTILSYAWRQDDSYLKVSRYGFRSSAAAVPRAMPAGVLAQFSGEAVALSYAREDHGVRWGVGWFPANRSRTRLLVPSASGRQEVAHGTVESDIALRAGVQAPLGDALAFGASYAYEHDVSEFHVSPAMSGLDEMLTLRGTYDSKFGVVGLAWRPAEGTTLAADYEHGSVRGPNISETVNLWYFGLEQFLSRSWSVKLTNLDQAWGLSASYYRGTDFSAGASYSPSAFRRTAEYLGNADVTYLWLTGSW
jgi:hypothetical protein